MFIICFDNIVDLCSFNNFAYFGGAKIAAADGEGSCRQEGCFSARSY